MRHMPMLGNQTIKIVLRIKLLLTIELMTIWHLGIIFAISNYKKFMK